MAEPSNTVDMDPNHENGKERALSLNALPHELQLEITGFLSFVDTQMLRGTSRHFQNLIPSPTHDDLLKAEDTFEVRMKKLLYCNACSRLRKADKFSAKMQRTNAKGNKGGKWTRFCIECGIRPLTGNAADKRKFGRGIRWHNCGVPFVRCLRCGRCAQTHASGMVKLCLGCHTQDVETARRQAEMDRIERERSERAERHAQREERRQVWLSDGVGAPSEFSDYDKSVVDAYDQDDWEQDNYAGVEFEMNYSAHS